MRFKFSVCASLVLFVASMALGWSDPQFSRLDEVVSVDEKSTENSGSTEVASEASAIGSSEADAVAEEVEVTTDEKAKFKDLLKSSRPWKSPDYSGQQAALGWSETAFLVPKGLESRVNFWRDIYTKYTTDQGVLHDSEHVSVVYASIDFRPIMNDPRLSDREKSRARRKLVSDKKKEIIERLARLSKVKVQQGETPQGLDAADLHIWGMYAAVDEPNKFVKAQHRKRLRFQLGQSDRFLQGIYYSGRYLEQMEEIFRARGLPIELTRLPFVESSFNIKARSRVGASGIWQFMRYTGRRFMRINYAVDERNDPIRSTEAAASLFRMNYNMLGQWPLAITGYNHGPAGVQRVVRKFQTDNIVELVDERYGRFGFASANFYACFLAALDVEKNASKYFGDRAVWASPLDTKEIRLSRNVSKKMLLKWFNGDESQAKDLNPHFLKSFWLGYASANPKDFVRVYTPQYDLAVQDLNSLPSALVAARETASSGGAGGDVQYYHINSGETLSEIAMQLGVSLTILKELNGIENPRAIRAGQKIMIPPARGR